MSTNSKKRHNAPVRLEENPEKRARLARESPPPSHRPCNQTASTNPTLPKAKATPIASDSKQSQAKLQKASEPAKKRVKINKIAAPKPFPAVAASASATGPRSAYKEGKNYICLTRKTSLAAYMRRCKNLVINDGYKVLHLHAAGAAIPLLLQLSCALPPILPFSKDEIHTDVSTGTVEIQDEIIPDDEEEDLTYRTRGKSTLYVIIRFGDGQPEKDGSKLVPLSSGSKSKPPKPLPKPKKTAGSREILVFEEPEQEQETI